MSALDEGRIGMFAVNSSQFKRIEPPSANGKRQTANGKRQTAYCLLLTASLITWIVTTSDALPPLPSSTLTKTGTGPSTIGALHGVRAADAVEGADGRRACSGLRQGRLWQGGKRVRRRHDPGNQGSGQQ